uniref:PIN domain-containing protein n=1 Tax=termite gut metagenome TaxID=433724 RepID=S0DEI0_9ZZZZ
MIWRNQDPFDRFLAAQSILEDAPLVTVDRAFSAIPGLTVLWDMPSEPKERGQRLKEKRIGKRVDQKANPEKRLP